jgi:hypothetical protein
MDIWTVLVIVLLIVVLYLRLRFEAWVGEKHDRIVRDLFVKAGADRPYSACRLEELGLKLKFWNFALLRDYKNEAVKRLITTGEIQQIGDGRFYLVPNSDSFDRNLRQ